jgi:hypothetical protein
MPANIVRIGEVYGVGTRYWVFPSVPQRVYVCFRRLISASCSSPVLEALAKLANSQSFVANIMECAN